MYDYWKHLPNKRKSKLEALTVSWEVLPHSKNKKYFHIVMVQYNNNTL